MKSLFCRSLLTASLVLPFSLGALADTVYRQVDKEGNVSYSGKPPKEGGKVEAVDINPDQNVVAPHTTPETERLEAEERSRYWSNQQQQQQSQSQHEGDIAAAEARLRQAQEMRDAGQALQPGDLIGKQSGGTRSSPQRVDRLQRLDDDVRAAQENLEEVRRRQ